MSYTKGLIDTVKVKKVWLNELIEKSKQRDDLLEACKYAFENLKPQGSVKKDFSGHNAIATLSRAIYKAEGGK